MDLSVVRGGFSLFLPLTKADEEKRLVWGRAAVEELDKSREIMDYTSAKPEFHKWSDGFAKATMGKSFGNIRAMHNPKHLAGKVAEIIYNDDAKAIDICVKVLDPVDWAKVEEGGYTGFSIGGGYVKKWADQPTGGTRYTPRIQEISFVDSPCIPGALIMEMQKQDGTTTEVLLKGTPRTFGELLPPPSFEQLRKIGGGAKTMLAGGVGGAVGTAAAGSTGSGGAIGGEIGSLGGEVLGSRFGPGGAAVGSAALGYIGTKIGGMFDSTPAASSSAEEAVPSSSKLKIAKTPKMPKFRLPAFKGVPTFADLRKADGFHPAHELRERLRQDIGAATDAYRPRMRRRVRLHKAVHPPKTKGFRALRTGQRLPGIHYGSRSAPLSAPGTPGTAIMRQAARAKLPSSSFHTTAAAPSGMGARSQPFKKRWDVSKHPREHTGEFASKTGEKTGRFLGGGAGAAGGALLGITHGARIGEGAARHGAVLYHRLRGSPSRVGEAAEMMAGPIGRQIGHSYGHVAGAGVLGLGGALAGGAAGALVDRAMRYRRAKKAGRLDVYRRLNEETSSRPTSFKQVKASTTRALAAGRRVKSVADTVMGKGRAMDGMEKAGDYDVGSASSSDVTSASSMLGGSTAAKKPLRSSATSAAPIAAPSVSSSGISDTGGTSPSMAMPSYMGKRLRKQGIGGAAAHASIAMTRHLAHRVLPKYMAVAGGAAGAKAGYEAARRVGGRMAARMVAANEKLGISPSAGLGGHGPGLIRHGERTIHNLGRRLTARQKKILLGTAIGGGVGGAVTGAVVGHQAARHGARHIDRHLTTHYGRPLAPGEKKPWMGKSAVPGSRLIKQGGGLLGSKPNPPGINMPEPRGSKNRRGAFFKAAYEGSAEDNREDRRGARRTGVSRETYEGTRQDRREDAAGEKRLGKLHPAVAIGLHHVAQGAATGALIGMGVAAGHRFKKAPRHTLGHHLGYGILFGPGYVGYRAGRAIGQRPRDDDEADKQERRGNLGKLSVGSALVRGALKAGIGKPAIRGIGRVGQSLKATGSSAATRLSATASKLGGSARSAAMGAINSPGGESAIRAAGRAGKAIAARPFAAGATAGIAGGAMLGADAANRRQDANKQLTNGDLWKVLGSGLSQGPPYRRAASVAASIAPKRVLRGKLGVAAAAGAGLAGLAGYAATSRRPQAQGANKQELIERLRKNVLLQDDNTVSQWKQARSDQWQPQPFWQMPKDTNDPKQVTMPGFPEQSYGPSQGPLSAIGSLFGGKSENPYGTLRKAASPEAREKVRLTMHEFKHGKLKSFRADRPKSKMPKVTNRKQAIAIALSQARRMGKGEDGLVVAALADRLAKRRLESGDRSLFDHGEKTKGAFVRADEPPSGGVVRLLGAMARQRVRGELISRSDLPGAGARYASNLAAARGYSTHPLMPVAGALGAAGGAQVAKDLINTAGVGAASLIHSGVAAARTSSTRKAIAQLSPKQHAQRIAAAKARWKKEMGHVDMAGHHAALEGHAGRAILGRDSKIARVKEEAEHFWHHTADAHAAYDKMKPHVDKDASIIMKIPHSTGMHGSGHLVHNPDKISSEHFSRFGKPTKKIYLMHPDEVDDWIKRHGKKDASLDMPLSEVRRSSTMGPKLAEIEAHERAAGQHYEPGKERYDFTKSAPSGLVEHYDQVIEALELPLDLFEATEAA